MASDLTSTPPPFGDLVRDLHQLRREGLRSPHWWSRLPTLAWLATRLADDRGTPASELLERALAEACQQIDDGNEWSEAALCLFGLAPGLRAASLGRRRAAAAGICWIQPDSLRRRHENRLVENVADQLLRIAARTP